MTDDEPYFARTVTARSLEEILMAARISPPARPGSLLKSARRDTSQRSSTPHGTSRHFSAPRITTQRNVYLSLIRRLPCVSCDADKDIQAAHVRLSVPGKPNAGVGRKPGHEWCVPLCSVCHAKQHAIGEPEFWRELGIDPIAIAQSLAGCKGIEEMRGFVYAAREKRK